MKQDVEVVMCWAMYERRFSSICEFEYTLEINVKSHLYNIS